MNLYHYQWFHDMNALRLLHNFIIICFWSYRLPNGDSSSATLGVLFQAPYFITFVLPYDHNYIKISRFQEWSYHFYIYLGYYQLVKIDDAWKAMMLGSLTPLINIQFLYYICTQTRITILRMMMNTKWSQRSLNSFPSPY